MFLTTTCRTGLPRRKGVGVGKTKTPSDTTLRVGDTFTAGYGSEVDGVEWTVGPAAGAGGVGCRPP